MKVKLSEIMEAIETSNEYSENFLDCETGELVWVSEMAMTREEMDEIYNRLDEHGFYRLPTSFDIREYDLMRRFVSSFPEKARNRLAKAINGKGAFGRFRDTIRQMGVDEQWYAYREAAYREKTIEWCEDNGLEYEE